MNRSFFHAVHSCRDVTSYVSTPPASKTRCSICGNTVALEASKTDEQGSAVHEECYVGRTIALLEAQQQALTPSPSRVLQIEPISPEMMWPRW
jgi:LSD1 subclass zinc finger protein